MTGTKTESFQTRAFLSWRSYHYASAAAGDARYGEHGDEVAGGASGVSRDGGGCSCEGD